MENKTNNTTLELVTKCTDRRECQRGFFWKHEYFKLPVKQDRRRSEPLLHVINQLSRSTKNRKYNGIAAVVMRNDGSYDLIVAGEAMTKQGALLGGVSRLQELLSCMMGSLSEYLDDG